MKQSEIQKPSLDKQESSDSEDLDITCDSSCGLKYHLHNHAKKIKAFFQRIFQKLKMIVL
jgi:hypothetical protein